MAAAIPRSETFRRIAGVCTALAALIVLAGFPLVAFAGVIPGSDAPYINMGLVALLLGVTLAPGAWSDNRQNSSKFALAARGVGRAVALLLILTGSLLLFGATGGLGAIAPRWVLPAAYVAWFGFFAWMPISSIALRSKTRLDRALFWLGGAAGAAVVVLLAASALIFVMLPGYVETGAGVIPSLVFDLVIWLVPVAWLSLFSVRLWTSGAEPR